MDELQFEIFGEQRFPEAHEKAAVLCWRIIDGHVFHDGNKRTGLLCLMTILENNGLALTVSEKEAYAIALDIGDHKKVSQDDFIEWVKLRIIPTEKTPVEGVRFTKEGLSGYIASLSSQESDHREINPPQAGPLPTTDQRPRG